MVGLALALSIGGLAILPMLAYHVQQLLIDTVLAGRLRAKDVF
jgi:predicted Na+-dependent transporter